MSVSVLHRTRADLIRSAAAPSSSAAALIKQRDGSIPHSELFALPSTLKRLTSSVLEETGFDGAIQYSVGLPSALIQQARDMIMRVGTAQSPAGSNVETIKDFGREFCDPSVWAMATAKPKELCPNHDCGGRHILADCQKRNSGGRCPTPNRQVPSWFAQLSDQGGRHSQGTTMWSSQGR